MTDIYSVSVNGEGVLHATIRLDSKTPREIPPCEVQAVKNFWPEMSVHGLVRQKKEVLFIKAPPAIVAMFTDAFAHLFVAVAVHDPRSEAYVVAISKNRDKYPLGTNLSPKDFLRTPTKNWWERISDRFSLQRS